MATVGRGADQYTVRFPDGLRDRIKVAAEENGRSMNAEIVATLEERYPDSDALGQLTEAIKDYATFVQSLPEGAEKDAAREKLHDVIEIATDRLGRVERGLNALLQGSRKPSLRKKA